MLVTWPGCIACVYCTGYAAKQPSELHLDVCKPQRGSCPSPPPARCYQHCQVEQATARCFRHSYTVYCIRMLQYLRLHGMQIVDTGVSDITAWRFSLPGQAGWRCLHFAHAPPLQAWCYV